MTIRIARKRLCVAWFVGAGAIIVFVIVQSLSGVYGDKTQEAWSWLLPTILPTLSLIVAVLFAAAPADTERERRRVDRFTSLLAFWISISYLSVVSLTLLIAPMAKATPLELMRMSNFWLGPLQGLVGCCLGRFFLHEETTVSK